MKLGTAFYFDFWHFQKCHFWKKNYSFSRWIRQFLANFEAFIKWHFQYLDFGKCHSKQTSPTTFNIGPTLQNFDLRKRYSIYGQKYLDLSYLTKSNYLMVVLFYYIQIQNSENVFTYLSLKCFLPKKLSLFSNLQSVLDLSKKEVDIIHY